MARLPRICPAGITQHIIQRGNNRRVCFVSDQDLKAYANWLKKYASQYGVAVHAWVFMTNHVHLLATPEMEGGLSVMMQSLGRRYVRYFNYTHRQSGTLWEGRFKSCLVESDSYLLTCYRYIELNPVRAGMVKDPADYSWSSYQRNALGISTELCSPHSAYQQLGANKAQRLNAYRALFGTYIPDELISDIRNATNQGMAVGSGRFKEEIEQLYGRRVKIRKKGRPRKNVI